MHRLSRANRIVTTQPAPAPAGAKEATMAEARKELMEQYDKYRARWIETYGTDAGYGEWFTEQLNRLL